MRHRFLLLGLIAISTTTGSCSGNTHYGDEPWNVRISSDQRPTSDLAEHEKCSTLGGIKTVFLMDRSVASDGAYLGVTFRLHNGTASDIRVQYSSSFLEHITLYDSSMKKVPLREGVGIGDYPGIEVVVPARGSVDRRVIMDVDLQYDLVPGEYFVAFRYDKRMTPSATVAGNEYWVPWCMELYPVSVQE